MKNKLILLISLLMLVILTNCTKNTEIPKREFRAVWFTTVKNLDWPATPNETVEDQKQNAIEMLNKLKKANFNAIIFQVRCECDAFYKSSYDPWSYYLTGEQGKAPTPFYDPLQFMIDESHKRSMELHAWINPFRAVKGIGDFELSEKHVAKTNPDWVYIAGKTKYLNAGIPEVRNYITNVIVEIINNYDIDGIHFDDYFYPYAKITNQDSLTFIKYNRNIKDIDDWRRDNINIFVSQVNDSIQALKPNLKFGISPFGIWKPEHPKGIKSMNAYDILYCDPITWLNEKTVDYITPQLYWPIGGNQDYYRLVNWWSERLNGRHFYSGHAPYRLPKWKDDEIINQILVNRDNEKCLGSAFFRTNIGILDNPKGLYDSLLTNYYKYPAIPPVMDWKKSSKPNSPSNLKFNFNDEINKNILTWDKDSLERHHNFVVYKLTDKSKIKEKINNPKNIVEICSSNSSLLKPVKTKGPVYYAVSKLNRDNLESNISEIIKIDSPKNPVLISPKNNTYFEGNSIRFTWKKQNDALCYGIQFSSDPNFENDIFEYNNIIDNSVLIGGFFNPNYYWRVRSFGAGGASEYSNYYSLKSLHKNLHILED